MNILVIGGGGREHALAWKLSQSPRVKKLYCAPGNPGIASLAECVAINVTDNKSLGSFAKEHNIDLTVVGPELPLTNGIVDYFNELGLKIFGPNQMAAQIEGSKAFAKELMHKYGIPTAKSEVFTDANAAIRYIQEQGAPIVVKADGLAAGKGVVVAMTVEEATAAVEMIMLDKFFGNAGAQVVVEEYLRGEEASVLAFTDGITVRPMVAAQDHKRVFDGDQGPNTGGMGAYAPAPVVTPTLEKRVVTEILQPVIKAMQEEGRPYTGCLYAGLMITDTGPKVIEFNARFGDPETQVVLPLVASDLVDIMEACIEQRLKGIEVEWSNQAAVCIVLAAGGYPGEYRKGDTIHGISQAEEKGALVFHAGTAFNADEVVTNGGRVLGVTATGFRIELAIKKAYEAAGKIHFRDMHFRNDIACRALNRV